MHQIQESLMRRVRFVSQNYRKGKLNTKTHPFYHSAFGEFHQKCFLSTRLKQSSTCRSYVPLNLTRTLSRWPLWTSHSVSTPTNHTLSHSHSPLLIIPLRVFHVWKYNNWSTQPPPRSPSCVCLSAAPRVRVGPGDVLAWQQVPENETCSMFVVQRNRWRETRSSWPRERRKLCKSYSKFTPVRKVCSKLGNEIENCACWQEQHDFLRLSPPKKG